MIIRILKFIFIIDNAPFSAENFDCGGFILPPQHKKCSRSVFHTVILLQIFFSQFSMRRLNLPVYSFIVLDFSPFILWVVEAESEGGDFWVGKVDVCGEHVY